MNYDNIIRQKATVSNDYMLVLQDLMGEVEAVYQYDTHINHASNNTAKNIFTAIRNDELTHIGMLLGLLEHLKPEYIMHLEKGHQEFLNAIEQSNN